LKRILSLFSGAGGMDIGFLGNFSLPIPLAKVLEEEFRFINGNTLPQNPFEIVYANDINKYGAICYKNYFQKYNRPFEHYELKSIIDKLKEVDTGNSFFPKNIELVIGGFPCQDFSLAGKRMGFQSIKNHLGENTPQTELDNRGNLYLAMKRVIEITKPKMFVAENVKGLFLHKKTLKK
jgi:DNA (cytosine-5)-methyltransferase 1